MAKRSAPIAQTTPGSPAPLPQGIDTAKFEHLAQVGGIQTATLDYPGIGGNASQGARVALVNTGSPLRFTVALDRGGDIVEAFYNQHSLAYLTPNGYKPPSHAYHHEEDWLSSWPGGLVTTCGPRYIGGPRIENDEKTSLHGYFSNTPAAVEMLLNPDPARGRTEMLLSMVIREARMYGPTVEIRRHIQCKLGVPEIVLHDVVTNRCDKPLPHNWLYHVNVGYPLLDRGSKFIYRGPASLAFAPDKNVNAAAFNRWKTVTDGLPQHVGSTSRVFFIDVPPDREGLCHVGIINRKLGLALELEYPKEQLPRLGNWQHLGQRGCYVSGIEPFYGSLMGKASDPHPHVDTWLEPGESRRYQLRLRALAGSAQLQQFAAHDGPVTA